MTNVPSCRNWQVNGLCRHCQGHQGKGAADGAGVAGCGDGSDGCWFGPVDQQQGGQAGEGASARVHNPQHPTVPSRCVGLAGPNLADQDRSDHGWHASGG